MSHDDRRRVTLYPLEQSVVLTDEVSNVRVVDVRVQGTGDTVPFRFDSRTGTLDLPVPDRIPAGRPVEIFYEGVRVAEVWDTPLYGDPAEPDLPLPEAAPERVPVGQFNAGAYRSAAVTVPVRPPAEPPRQPWYKRAFRRAVLAVFGWLHQHFGPH